MLIVFFWSLYIEKAAEIIELNWIELNWKSNFMPFFVKKKK